MNYKCNISELGIMWLFLGAAMLQKEWILKGRCVGVEEGSRGQAMKGLRCHTGEFELFFSLGQWRTVGTTEEF